MTPVLCIFVCHHQRQLFSSIFSYHTSVDYHQYPVCHPEICCIHCPVCRHSSLIVELLFGVFSYVTSIDCHLCHSNITCIHYLVCNHIPSPYYCPICLHVSSLYITVLYVFICDQVQHRLYHCLVRNTSMFPYVSTL